MKTFSKKKSPLISLLSLNLKWKAVYEESITKGLCDGDEKGQRIKDTLLSVNCQQRPENEASLLDTNSKSMIMAPTIDITSSLEDMHYFCRCFCCWVVNNYCKLTLFHGWLEINWFSVTDFCWSRSRSSGN